MRVEIWSDFICPFCGIGQHRLEMALSSLPYRGAIEVIHRSFELDPQAGPPQPVASLLAKKYGMSPGQVRANTARIEAMAAADGLTPYRVGENLAGNTRLAHQLAAWASDHGQGRSVWAGLYRAYFGDGRNIFGETELLTIAAELSLNVDGAREALRSPVMAKRVQEEAAEARRLGARGVPFIVMDRKYAIPGAAEVAQMKATLQQAWRGSETAIAWTAANANQCEDGACILSEGT
jgi:predicted DsbA family dithiol-disulfide isomerase